MEGLDIIRLPITAQGAATAVVALLVSVVAGVAVSGIGVDYVAPDFGDVPACHIEAYPTTTTATFTCTIPAVTDAATAASDATKSPLTPTPTLPDDMTGGTHTVTWTGASGSQSATAVSLPVGNHKVTWTATDASGNMATTTQLVIVSDTKPPAFTPEPASAVAIKATGSTTMITASKVGVAAVDASGTRILKPSVDEVKANKSVNVLWTATDAVGNVARVRQVVTAEDRDAPNIVPANPPAVTLQTAGTYLDITAEAAGIRAEDPDGIDPNPEITPSPERLTVGTHPVAWTATDAADNDSAPATQSITIVPKFALTSSSISNYGIDLVFSQDVDPKTAGGIRAAKLDAPRVIDAQPAISVSEKTVRIDPKRDPTFPSPGFHRDTFCEPRGITYDCYKINGQWIITLPASLASVHGFSLHDGNQPSFEACRAQVADATAAVVGCHTPVLRSP